MVGIAGVGKSQLAMTLALLCALEYKEQNVLFIDTDHKNFSGKRFYQMTSEKIRQQAIRSDVDIQEKVDQIAERVRVLHIETLEELEKRFFLKLRIYFYFVSSHGDSNSVD